MRRSRLTRVLLAAAVIAAAVAAATAANLALLEHAGSSDSPVGHLNPQVDLIGEGSMPAPTFADRDDDRPSSDDPAATGPGEDGHDADDD